MRVLGRKIRIFLKEVVVKVFGKKTWLINDEQYTKLIFYIMHGRKLNLDNPKTFNEHICYRKIRVSDYDLYMYCDKYEVRKYVEKTIGTKYLKKIFGIYNCVEEIPFVDLPSKFVLKTTHGSGYNVLIHNTKGLNISNISRKLKKWMRNNYYHKGREKNYYLIKPRIISELFLENEDGKVIYEIELFCFFGKVKFVFITSEKKSCKFINIYDSSWNLLDLNWGYENFFLKRIPFNKEEAIILAEKLSSPFDFVRVDLINVNDTICFNELTFHPGGGFVRFDPPKYDLIFGHYFK
jgi:hypothetical protein